MAKKSKQRPARQKKDQSGCMWGLISIFDFRHGRTTRRLLSDRRRYMTKNTPDSPFLTSEANLLTNLEEMDRSIEDGEKIEKPAFDLVKTRVKELIEEEMVIERGPKKQNDNDKVESFDSKRGSHVANHKHKHTGKPLKQSFEISEKPSKKSFDHEISISHQVSAQKASQYHDLEALVKEILLIHQKKNEQHGDLDTGTKQSFPIVREKLIAAVEVLMNEKSTNGDHEKEMFRMLSSNKEMFLKLLQDQYQNLLLQNSDRKSTSKTMASSNLLKKETDDQGSEEPVINKHRKFFRRRSKSQESISSSGKDKIVVLKSGSPDNQVQTGNEIHIERSTSQFSFMEIKRRLKHAMGKEQQTARSGERTGKTFVDGGWSSPNRDHFYTERFARVSKLRESETKTRDPNHQMSNIYVEAKKHLSEMLTSGDENAESMIRSLPKSLGRYLYLQEYNSLSPVMSPRPQMRPSSHEDLRMVNESQSSTTNNDLEKKLVVPYNVTSEAVREIVKSPSCDKELKQEMKVLDGSCEPCSSSNGKDDDHDGAIFDGSNEERSSESLKPDFPDENELSSSRTLMEPSVTSKTEELEITPSDKTARPSPISVLEPLFSDDDISPARTLSRPVEAAVQPLCIEFEETVSPAEDQQIQIRNSTDSEESAFEYVEAVLLSSDLNWFEFEKRWLSSVEILDPSLFDEVEAFSSRPRHDQRLLFDSANEVLEKVCDRFIVESTFIKRNIWPVPKGMDLINEVWGRLESCLYKLYPQDLNKLVKDDLETSTMWLDLRSESREIVIKIEESIFEESMDDALLSLLNAHVVGEILRDETNNALSCS